MGDNKVELYCHHEKIPVLAKIPQSTEIAELYSNGTPFVKDLSGWKAEFKKMFAEIKEEVKKRKSSQ